MAILDQPGGNENAQFEVGVQKDRPMRSYQWTCTNPNCPSPIQIGRVEDGCQACGAGADGIPGVPLKPTDFNCSACKGTGNVERKCGTCDGTGMTDAPQLGEPPPTCEKCGGAGTLAFTCGRCDGSGIDPNPEPKVTIAEGMTAAEKMLNSTNPIFAELRRRALAPETMNQVRERAREIMKLPSIDDGVPGAVTSPDRVVRYRLIRYEGPAGAVAKTIDNSLQGCWVEENGTSLTAIEIAAPKAPAVHQAIQEAVERPVEWPARSKY